MEAPCQYCVQSLFEGHVQTVQILLLLVVGAFLRIAPRGQLFDHQAHNTAPATLRQTIECGKRGFDLGKATPGVADVRAHARLDDVAIQIRGYGNANAFLLYGRDCVPRRLGRKHAKARVLAAGNTAQCVVDALEPFHFGEVSCGAPRHAQEEPTFFFRGVSNRSFGVAG